VEGEGSNGDMCRRPQEKISMTSSSFNVRILLELNLMVVADILFWFFKSYLMLMLSFIVFLYSTMMRSSLLLRVGFLTDIEMKAQEGCI
jgi:hypothetical protein